MATMVSAISAIPIETRMPTSPEAMKVTTFDNWVDPATSATEKAIRSIAGSASAPIIISRDAPMPPKLVPTSMPASAVKKRVLLRSATSAIRSAVQLNASPVANVGTRAAATQVAAKIM